MEQFKQMTFHGLGQETPEKPFAVSLILTVDRLFIYSIILLIVIVLIFSLGVEHGKKIAAEKIEQTLINTAAVSAPVGEPALSAGRVSSFLSKKESAPAVRSPVLASKEKTLSLPDSLKEEPGRNISPAKKETSVAVPPVHASPAPRALSEKKTIYFIQVASYANETDAASLAARLKTEGYAASVNVRGKYKAVVIGNFPARNEAEKVLNALKKKYKDAFVRRKEL